MSVRQGFKRCIRNACGFFIACWLADSVLTVGSAAVGWASMPEIGDVLTPETAADRYRNDMVRMAVTRFSYPNVNYAEIRPTVQALQQVFGRAHFYAQFVSGETVDSDRYDLVLGSAGTYRRFTHRGTRDIASLVSDKFPDPNHAEGSVFAVIDRPGAPKTLADLKGARLITTGPKAFTGHQTAMGEVLAAGFDPDHFFSEMPEAYHNMVTGLAWLRSGRGDAAVFRTCFLEELAAAGADVSDIRVINEKKVPGFACKTSTALYPNWTVFITPHANPEIARKAASVLLALPAGTLGEHWTVATDFTPVDELFRNLRIGPYEYLRRWSLTDFLTHYWEWFFFASVLVVGLVWHSVRSDRLVAKRTRQLRDAWAREKMLLGRAEAAAQHLASIQKASLIGQMSSMIAHELRQPLTSIINYTQGLMRLLDKVTDPARPRLEVGVSAVRREAEKADDIVEKVRAYARHQQATTERGSFDLRETVRTAADNLTALNRWFTPVRLAPGGAVVITADLLEIEVAAVNLIKNALEASAGLQGAEVTIAVTENGTDAVLSITNPAPGLTGESFERLSASTASTKAEGLGLGLSIVRGIAESHAGRLVFIRSTPESLRVELRLPMRRL